MSVSNLPPNVLLNDPPIENPVETLNVNLINFKSGHCSEHPFTAVDVKTEPLDAHFEEKPGCSQWDPRRDGNSSPNLKMEDVDGECTSSRFGNDINNIYESSDYNIKHELSSDDSCNIETTSTSVELKKEEEEIKLGNDIKHEEVMLDDIKSSGGKKKKQRRNKAANKERRPGLVNYICEICNYQTRFKPHYRAHLVTHKSPEEIDWFECPLCSHKTKTKANLYAHISTHKPTDQIYHCTECSYKTKYRKTYLTHLFDHGIVKIDQFKCSYCDYETPNKYTLEMHEVIHKDATETSIFSCLHCPYKGKRKRDLRVHSIIHKSSDEVTMFQCTHCEYRTKRKADLKSHAIKHMSPEEVEVLQCPYCSYHTKYKSAFKTHMGRHQNPDEVELFKCDHCDYKTRFKQYLKKHRLFKHKVEERPSKSLLNLV